MFSLPTILPHDPHPLYYPSLLTHTQQQINANYNNNNTTNTQAPSDPRNPPHHQQPGNNANHAHHHHHPHHHQHRTPLTILAADEAIIAYRKRALARYGASWLRPPGVSKTLQGRDDERAEREEVEAQREREARAEEEEMMAGVEGEEEEEEEGGGEAGGEAGQAGEGEEGAGVDLDADVPDADADAGGEWSDDDDDDDDEDDDEDEDGDQSAAAMGGEEEEEEDIEEYDSADAAMTGPSRRSLGMGMGMYDGPATPPPDDRTPQRFRLNPFQAPTAEGDGDYGSPLAARHSQRAAAARARDVSPGVVAAAAAASRRAGGTGMTHIDAAVRLGGQPSGSHVATTAAAAITTPQHSSGVTEMGEEVDLDDAIPMDETMMEEGSYEHTDTEVEDPSSEDEGMPGGSSSGLGGVGSRSVFGRAGIGGGGGGISAAVRRLSGQDRRGSGAERRVSGGGEGRASAARRTSGRGRGL